MVHYFILYLEVSITPVTTNRPTVYPFQNIIPTLDEAMMIRQKRLLSLVLMYCNENCFVCLDIFSPKQNEQKIADHRRQIAI